MAFISILVKYPPNDLLIDVNILMILDIQNRFYAILTCLLLKTATREKNVFQYYHKILILS